MKVGIFGASGSVGGQALDVISANRDKFEAVFLSAHSDADGLIRRAAEFFPPYIALTDDAYADSAEKRTEFEKKVAAIKSAPSSESRAKLEKEAFGGESLCPSRARPPSSEKNAEFEKRVLDIANEGYNPVILYGSGYCGEIFKDGKNPLSLDLAVVATAGGSGLAPSYSAIKSGVSLALANKETLVAGGEIIMREAKKRGVSVIPVDSEHSAISECLSGNDRGDVRRLILTASGGAFRDYSAERLKTASAKDALKHPTWRMGRKVTIDSATMMNKGLEIIEAMRLFGLPESKIDVVVHPESVVHSMVEFFDNTVMAMMSVPDMRIPISRALGIAYSECETAKKSRESRGAEARTGGFYSYGSGRGFARIKNPASSLDLIKTASLTFFPPDLQRFPCLKIAREAAAAGGIMPAALNAANERAVDDFLDGRIGFTDVAPRISAVLERTKTLSPQSVGEIFEAEREAKRIYGELFAIANARA